MTDDREFVHARRLEADYRAMQRLPGPLITWQPDWTNIPGRTYPNRYLVTFHLLAPTVEGDRREHVIEIDCSSYDYPIRYLPQVKFRTAVIKHPHVYSDNSRRICLGGFPLSEDLAKLCVRLARFFQYDPLLINPKSLASREFYEWYIQNRGRLPLDHSPLPNLDGTAGFKVTQKANPPEVPTFKVKRQ